jgi:Rrf2 family iron-sulfur cluster assembly transcriptional regulator
VAKLLSTLSTAGLVNGSRGPGGGYWLAKAPAGISLADITAEFERELDGVLCPFGPGWCGNGDPCPLHDQLTTFDKEWNDFLRNTTLAVFMSSGRVR